jgi:hypothetical protein
MTAKEDRIWEIHKRVEELDELLGGYAQGIPVDNPRTLSTEELNYWSDRREERRMLLEELEDLLRR